MSITLREIDVIMLPSNNEPITGQICRLNSDSSQLRYHFEGGSPSIPQELYFLSDDDINEGDWRIIRHPLTGEYCPPSQYFDNAPDSYKSLEHSHKVIGTTDIKIDLPRPSNYFIQVFIGSFNTNVIIDKVRVVYETRFGVEGFLKVGLRVEPKTDEKNILNIFV